VRASPTSRLPLELLGSRDEKVCAGTSTFPPESTVWQVPSAQHGPGSLVQKRTMLLNILVWFIRTNASLFSIQHHLGDDFPEHNEI